MKQRKELRQPKRMIMPQKNFGENEKKTNFRFLKANKHAKPVASGPQR